MKALERILGSQTFRVAATLMLLGVIAWRVNPQHLISATGRLEPPRLLAAALLTVPFLYLKVLRWLFMLRFAGSAATFTDAALSLIGGMGVALLTPGRLGEVARVAYLPDSRKLRLSALVLLDKFFDVLVLVLLASVGAWTILGWEVGVVLLILGVAGLIVTLSPRLFVRPVGFLTSKAPLGGRTREVFSALESLSPKATALYLLLTTGAFLLVIGQFGIILGGNADVSPRVAFLTFPLVILTNVVPLTVAGLGLREGAAVLLLGHYHVPPALAAVSAFAMFFLNTALPGVAGAFVPMFHRRRTIPTG